MPPAAKKNCSVILYDFNTANPEATRNLVLRIFADKYFRLSKDLTKVIVTSVNKTSNKLNATTFGYENICVATDIIGYDPKSFARIFDRNNFEPVKSNWLEAIQVGIDCLRRDFADINGIVTKQLLFVTDLSVQLSSSADHILNRITSDLDAYEIFLYIVGPQVTLPRPITCKDDVEPVMKEWIEKLSGDDDDNIKIASKIISKTKNSVICDYKIGAELFKMYTNPMGGFPWHVPLSFGTLLEIPTTTIRLLNHKVQLKLRGDKSEDRSVVVWVHREDEEIEIEFQDIVRGVKRHGKFVPIDSEVNSMLKCEGPRRFQVVGFTDQKNIPEYFMVGDGTRAVIPNSKKPKHNNALYALIDVLYRKGMYGIALQAYNANNKPKYNVLIPRPDHIPKCLMMVQLPYADDVRFTYVESALKDAGEQEVSDEVTAFLDSLDIHGTKCQIQVPLAVNLIDKERDVKVVNKALEKYLGKNINFEEVYLDLLHSTNDNPTEAQLKAVMPEMTVVVEKKKKKSSKYESNSQVE